MSFFSFLGHAAHTAEKDVSHGANAVFHFLGGSGNTTARKQLQKQAKAQPNNQPLQRAAAKPQQTTTPVESARDIAVSAARGIAKIPETISRSAADIGYNKVIAPTLDLPQQDLNAPSPTDPLRRTIYGSEPVKTYQSQAQDIHQATGLPAAPVAFGLAGLDLTGGLGKGAAKSVLEQGIKDYAKAKTPAEVRKIMKGTPPEVIDKLALPLSKTEDPNTIRNILHQHIKQPPSMVPETAAAVQDIRQATIPQTGEVIPPPSKDPFDEILGAVHGTPAAKGQTPVKGIATARAEQNALLSSERNQRFGQSAEAGRGESGTSGYLKERYALKGEYSKVDYKPLINDIGPERTESLFSAARDRINAVPDSVYQNLPKPLHPQAARFNTQTAVRKVLGLEPGLPTNSEIKLLHVVSPQLADEAKAAIPKYTQLFRFASNLFNNARSAKSTADFSMGGRQGLFVAPRHPVAWARANKESVKYAKSSAYFNKEMRAIHDDEWGQLTDKYNPNVLTGGAGHEEQFPGSDILSSKPLKKVGIGHVVAGSERAYTGGLTRLRKDILVNNYRAYGNSASEVEQKLGPKGIEGLIESVSTLTGRGGKKGGFISRNKELLNEGLFSPKLWASRLEPFNPKFWARIGPAGRKEAFQSLASFATVAATVLEAAHLAGAKIETDPRSSDFLKIHEGDTRYDILGGFQQNLVFGARELAESTKSSTSGKVTKFGGFGAPDSLSTFVDLLRNKSNPLIGTALNVKEGKDQFGNKINRGAEIAKLFEPISIEGSIQTIKHENSVSKGLAKNSPDFVGIGTQTYGTKEVNLPDKQQKYVDSIKDKNQQAATKLLLQTIKTAPAKDDVKTQIQAAMQKGDTNKVIKLAQDFNKKYDKTFDSWFKTNEKYYQKDDNLIKTYRKGYITEKTLDSWDAALQKSKGAPSL